MLLLLGTIFCFIANIHGYITNPEQIAFLDQLYEYTDGANWVYKQPLSTYGSVWEFTEEEDLNPCEDSWQGITCALTTCYETEYYGEPETVCDIIGE